MQSHPTLRIDVPEDPTWRAASRACGAVAGTALAWWIAQKAAWPLWLAVPGVVCAAAAFAWAAQRGLVTAVGSLAWNNNAWAWTPRGSAAAGGAAGAADEGGEPVMPRVAIDLGWWMLVRLEPAPDDVSLLEHVRRRARPAAWLTLSAASVRADWPLLRAALRSRRGLQPDGAFGAAQDTPAEGLPAR